MELAEKPILENYQGLLNVLIIEDSDNLATTLGITPERHDVLIDMLKEIFEKSESITDIMVALSRQVTHANELSYIMYHLGGLLERLRQH